jgi:recombinational DNA repair protein (RecF pathway)
MSTTSPAVERVVFCHRCGSLDDRRLYAPLRDGFVCAPCWHALGRPFPRAEAAPALVHAAELQTRERMTARGGTDRHLVRNGRT